MGLTVTLDRYPSKITADDVRAFRERSGMGLCEARDILCRREFLAALDGSPSAHELRQILREVVARVYPADPDA